MVVNSACLAFSIRFIINGLKYYWQIYVKCLLIPMFWCIFLFNVFVYVKAPYRLRI